MRSNRRPDFGNPKRTSPSADPLLGGSSHSAVDGMVPEFQSVS